MKNLMGILLAVLAFLIFVSPASAIPLDVYYVDGPQDNLYIPTEVHELGDRFPQDELIISSWEFTDITSCFDGNDDPLFPNILVTMTNMTNTNWYDVWYVADPETGLTNFDGWIGNAGLGDAEEAFKIDSAGINRPLIFENMRIDDIFQAGETWKFIIQDFSNALGGPPAPFDSIGIASASTGWPPSTGSILATVPEPATMALFGLGLLGLAGVSRRKKQ
ncbi:MAG: PEP-CTERM sorting domain-containing protein [Desulfobacteraceae bacterium]|nr:PEP-CTERM sorting domain-containing protein [Desulfobacteraceae bacterium]